MKLINLLGGYCWLSGINLNILVDILYVCERNIFIVSVSVCICVFNACTALAVWCGFARGTTTAPIFSGREEY